MCQGLDVHMGNKTSLPVRLEAFTMLPPPPPPPKGCLDPPTPPAVRLTRLTQANMVEAVGVMARSFAGDGKVEGEGTFNWAIGDVPLDTKLKALSWYLKWSFLICA